MERMIRVLLEVLVDFSEATSRDKFAVGRGGRKRNEGEADLV
jgi:hypothetical protein